MKGQDSINKHNKYIRELQSELDILTLECSLAGGSYNHKIGHRIGHLRAEIHATTLKRNDEIRKLYSPFAKGSNEK